MFILRRKAVQSARHLRIPARQYSAAHGKDAHHGGDHGHDHHDHHHSEPVAESFGTYFYVALGVIPLSIGTYVFSRPSADGQPTSITKLISKYSEIKEDVVMRNNSHTVAMEQAALDRNIFNNNAGPNHIDLRFPEIFNTGSPYNVVAGHGARNMDKVVEHYKQKYAEEDARRTKETARREAVEAAKKG